MEYIYGILACYKSGRLFKIYLSHINKQGVIIFYIYYNNNINYRFYFTLEIKERQARMKHIEERIEEYHNLMRAGLDEVAVQEYETAADYFSDAAYVLNKIDNEGIRAELANMYEVNPYDYAR